MIIKKIINGAEYDIELSREEMIDIAYELDIKETAESVETFIEEMNIEDYNDNAIMGFKMLEKFNDADKQRFYRYCAEGILNQMDADDLDFADDLTDIYNDIIEDALANISEFIESEEINID